VLYLSARILSDKLVSNKDLICCIKAHFFFGGGGGVFYPFFFIGF